MKYLIFLTLALAACAAPKPAPVTPAQPPAGSPQASQNTAACPVLYVLAPGNYIIDLAAGADVVLDPAWHEFVVYCSREEAAGALDSISGSPGEWRIYSLAGSPAELAKKEDGKLVLASPARLANWL